MFERPHHQRIAAVLQALDAARLREANCLFGGGTAMALRYGESVDIDFLVSDVAGYRALRQLLTGPQGVAPLLAPDAGVTQAREVRADQYGIRTLLEVAGAKIKLEIVLEGRIALDMPEPGTEICGVATLAPLDMAAGKLLANSDRWADDGVFSRDLIDLAMMQPGKPLLRRAIDKARAAYGDSVERDLAKAATQLLGREQRLERCMQALAMAVPKALLWQRIQGLAAHAARR